MGIADEMRNYVTDYDFNTYKERVAKERERDREKDGRRFNIIVLAGAILGTALVTMVISFYLSMYNLNQDILRSLDRLENSDKELREEMRTIRSLPIIYERRKNEVTGSTK